MSEYNMQICYYLQTGDELCVSYCNLFDERDKRQFELRTKYGFVCMCELCSCNENKRGEIEMYRNKYEKLDEQIVEEGTLDPRRGVDLVKKALVVMGKGMPMFPKFVAKNAYEGFQFALVCGNNLEEAQKFISMAWNARYIEGGEKFKETKEMLKYLQNPKAHPLYN